MQLGMIGLGRMGANMAQRLMRGGHGIVAFDPKAEARESARANGADPAADTLNVALAPTVAATLAGCTVIDGATVVSSLLPPPQAASSKLVNVTIISRHSQR